MDTIPEDCLEAILIHCNDSPVHLCAVSTVCRRWYNVTRRPAMWRHLTINMASMYGAYLRLMQSPYFEKQLEAVRHLTVYKPNKATRHTHVQPLMLKHLSGLTRLSTVNLCLQEISELVFQLRQQQGCGDHSPLTTLDCNRIETWCHNEPFSFSLLAGHAALRHITFQFRDEGHMGFAPTIHRAATEDGSLYPRESVCSLRIVCLRQAEHSALESILRYLDNPVPEMFTNDQEQQEAVMPLLSEWHRISGVLATKYHQIASMTELRQVELGLCYWWTATMWRDVFLPICLPGHISHLTLHGWTQLSRFSSKADSSVFVTDIRSDAEAAIADCFAVLQDLQELNLMDFCIGSGILQGILRSGSRLPLKRVAVSYSASLMFYINVHLLNLDDVIFTPIAQLFNCVASVSAYGSQCQFSVHFDPAWQKYASDDFKQAIEANMSQKLDFQLTYTPRNADHTKLIP